jgi:hypothetical protein
MHETILLILQMEGHDEGFFFQFYDIKNFVIFFKKKEKISLIFMRKGNK